MILFDKEFHKQFKKLPDAHKEKFYERLELFEVDASHPLLHNHPLHGKYGGCRSINVTGDLRAIYYKMVKKEMFVFITIGTHGNLYS